MFSYGSDIAIVHGAFLSNATQDHPLSEAVECIVSQVKKYCAAHLNDGSLGKIHRRINSALFVTLIKSQYENEYLGIEFESVHDLFPNLNWEIYLHLLVELDWRPYFLECLNQLDDFTLNYASEQVLHSGCLGMDNFNSYLIHCLLQSILNKPLSPYRVKCLETCTKLLNRYTLSEEFFTWTLDTIKCLMERMLNETSHYLITSRNLSIPTIGKYEKPSPQNDTLNKVLLGYKELIFVLENIFESCTSSLLNLKKVRECLLSLDNFVRCVALLRGPTFESDEFDQLQIIKYKLEKMVWIEANEDYSSLINAVKEDLISINDLCKKLKINNVLQDCLSPERARECVEYLTANEIVRNSLQRFLLLINRNSNGPESEEARKIFLDSCCQDFEFMSYYEKMELFLDTVGVRSECLKLKNYRKLLTTFLNQSIEGEFEKKLLYLCLQSPVETVQRLIDHAISIGGQISIYSKMLIFMSPLCNFSGIRGFKMLTELLNDSIIYYPKFQTKEKQNLISLMKELIQDESILDSNDVIDCLLNMLNRKRDPLVLDAALSFINEILETEAKRGKKLKSVTKTPKVVLVCLLCNFLTYAVMTRNGLLRERLLVSLDNLKALCTSDDLVLTKPEMYWMNEKLNTATPDLTQISAAQFFNFDVKQYHENTMRSYILRCCSKVPIKIRSFSKKDLVMEFSKILTYITQQEWILVFEGLIFVYEQIPMYMNIQDVFELLKVKPTKKNVVLSLYINALVLLGQAKHSTIPWHYMINSFISMVQQMFLETELQLDEISIAAGQIVYLLNTLCSHQEYLGKMSQPFTNLLLHLINQFKNIDGNDYRIMEPVFELIKVENIKNVTLANIKETPLIDI